MASNQNRLIIGAVLALASTLAMAGPAPKKCSALSKEIVEEGRTFRTCLTGQRSPVCAQLNQRTFDNDERKLPRAARGQEYLEGRVLLDKVPPPGRMRFVYLTEASRNKTKVLDQYYTADHYESFCKFD